MLNLNLRVFVIMTTLVLQTHVQALTLADEKRAQNLFKEIRCLVCQSQTISDSNSELASDLKALIREQILSGKSDNDIKSFLADKYGDWILMTPPFNKLTYILWISPLIILIFGVFIILQKQKSLSKK